MSGSTAASADKRNRRCDLTDTEGSGGGRSRSIPGIRTAMPNLSGRQSKGGHVIVAAVVDNNVVVADVDAIILWMLNDIFFCRCYCGC